MEGRGTVNLNLGRFELSKQWFLQAKETTAGTADSGSDIIICGGLALSQWQLGEHEAALHSVHEAEQVIAKADGISFAVFSGYHTTAETLLHAAQANQQDGKSMSDLLARAEAVLRMYRRFVRSIAIGAPGLWLCRARLSWLVGARDTALKQWKRSLEEARRCDMPFEVARAHHDLATHLPPDHPDRLEHARLAKQIHAQIGVGDPTAP